MSNADQINNPDWKPLVLRKRSKRAPAGKKKTVDDDSPPKIEKVPTQVRYEIQQKRSAKGWTQKDLATRCNLKKEVISQIESGKYKYDKRLIQKILRKLK